MWDYLIAHIDRLYGLGLLIFFGGVYFLILEKAVKGGYSLPVTFWLFYVTGNFTIFLIIPAGLSNLIPKWLYNIGIVSLMMWMSVTSVAVWNCVDPLHNFTESAAKWAMRAKRVVLTVDICAVVMFLSTHPNFFSQWANTSLSE